MTQIPDIVLIDINMPDMDELTVCENIREYIKAAFAPERFFCVYRLQGEPSTQRGCSNEV